MLLNVAAEKAIKGGSKPLDSRKQKSSLNNTIFRIVTSGLYIRPIEAIVRELCTNALDGHLNANKADVPFDVHLPNKLEPYFIVRDYGCSMSKDTMFDIYGVLGESTKNTSSKEIGGWGVGGKSPYAYTDTFFITTYLDGLKRIYQGSALAEESPLELLMEIPSDEPQGVEVKVPVKEEDFHRFVQAAETQLEPFEVRPNISGTQNFEYEYGFDAAMRKSYEVTLYLPNSDGSKLEFRKQTVEAIVNSDYPHAFGIQMGCVVYPINSTAENYEEFRSMLERISSLTGINSFIFKLPVDAVDIKPSREDLDYTERTNKVLKGIMDKVYAVAFKNYISLKRKVRQMPYNEAMSYLVNNADDGVFKYYLERTKHYNPILGCYSGLTDYKPRTERRIWRRLKNYFGEYRKNFVGAFPKNKQTPFYDLDKFKVVQTLEEKAKNYCDVGVSLAAFELNQGITVFLKSPSYVKKVLHYLDTNEDTNTGLYNGDSIDYISLGSLFHSYRYRSTEQREKELHTPKMNSNAALCFSAEELAFMTPILEKIYGKVEVIDTKSLPTGNVVADVTQRAIPRTQLEYTAAFINENGNVTDYASHIKVAYSYKEFEFFLEQLHKDLEYQVSTRAYEIVIHDRELSSPLYYPNSLLGMSSSVLLELLRMQKRNVVFVASPPAFAKRITESGKFLVTSIEDFKQDLLERVPAKAIRTMVKQVEINNIYSETLSNVRQSRRGWDTSRELKNAALLAHEMLRSPVLKQHFFKVLNPYKVRRLKYPKLAEYFYDERYKKTSYAQYNFTKRESKALAKRVIKRAQVLLEKRRMLNLVFACDEFNLMDNSTGITMHEYFQQIVKGVPDDNTETSAD